MNYFSWTTIDGLEWMIAFNWILHCSLCRIVNTGTGSESSLSSLFIFSASQPRLFLTRRRGGNLLATHSVIHCSTAAAFADLSNLNKCSHPTCLDTIFSPNLGSPLWRCTPVLIGNLWSTNCPLFWLLTLRLLYAHTHTHAAIRP